ncbi:inovirus Gp2 family protein [Vibrio splendidus]|uniref:inovirus Gp2 family protein n=1 Tax=Vibrio TaxID=662 RepID=UPI00036BA30E|nr:inovirus Gp2 family protein [Vibrio splendidus]PTO66541.1 inovirus Gp2 family protein [Vibrio splendidus]PTP03119.1 inovirus Gp2 family protein [Vibrio splendidus]PTP99418.1 inovirus Gp2 family protein [Vibrio splendidus]PTQ07679.1 inovirus Gp2 family protein [Vibrio splendidus]
MMKKLKTTTNDTFNGLPILKLKGGLVLSYLDKLYDTIDKAVTQHPRTTAIRVDLRLAKSLLFDDTGVIKNFIASLDAQIQADLSRKKRRGQTARSCKVRYAWCKERSTSLSHHYHLVLLLNKDVYHSLGRFDQKGNLSDMIKKAWCRALDIKANEGDSLVHFPDNPTYWLDKNSDKFDQQVDSLFKRASYLAKVETKHYGDRSRSFGCSRT